MDDGDGSECTDGKGERSGAEFAQRKSKLLGTLFVPCFGAKK